MKTSNLLIYKIHESHISIHFLFILFIYCILVRISKTKIGLKYFHVKCVHETTRSTLLLGLCITQRQKLKSKRKNYRNYIVQIKSGKYFPWLICQTTVAMPLYLGLVLSGESPSSKVFLLLLLESCCCCCDCCCCCGCCCCCSCCSCDWNSGFSVSSSLSSCFLCFSCIGSFNFVFSIWGLSLFTSASRTGFKKNSSAPSSKHLKPIVPINKYHLRNPNCKKVASFQERKFPKNVLLFYPQLPADSWRHIFRWHNHHRYVSKGGRLLQISGKKNPMNFHGCFQNWWPEKGSWKVKENKIYGISWTRFCLG